MVIEHTNVNASRKSAPQLPSISTKNKGGGALDRITAEKTSSKYKKDDGNNRADSSSDLFSIILYKSPRVMIQMSGFGHM